MKCVKLCLFAFDKGNVFIIDSLSVSMIAMLLIVNDGDHY